MVCGYRDEWYDTDDFDNTQRQKDLDELNLTTRLLCDLMKWLTSKELNQKVLWPGLCALEEIEGLDQWWIKHQKIDEQRKQS